MLKWYEFSHIKYKPNFLVKLAHLPGQSFASIPLPHAYSQDRTALPNCASAPISCMP